MSSIEDFPIDYLKQQYAIGAVSADNENYDCCTLSLKVARLIYEQTDSLTAENERLQKENKALCERYERASENLLGFKESAEERYDEIKKQYNKALQQIQQLQAETERSLKTIKVLAQDKHNNWKNFIAKMRECEQLEAELATYKAGNVPITQITADNESMAIEIEQLEAENKEKQELIDKLCSAEPCPECGYGVTGACYGCEIKRLQAELAKSKTEIQRLKDEH